MNAMPDKDAEGAWVAVVRQAANLARLSIDEAQARRLGRDFGRILEAFESLRAQDVEGVEPMTAPHPQVDVVRADEVRPSLERDALLAPAPESTGEFFAVPKTIDTKSDEKPSRGAPS